MKVFSFTPAGREGADQMIETNFDSELLSVDALERAFNDSVAVRSISHGLSAL